MKKSKATLAIVFMVALYAGVSYVEYDLAMHFRILFSVATVCGLFVLVSALVERPKATKTRLDFILVRWPLCCNPSIFVWRFACSHSRSARDPARVALATARCKDRVRRNS